MAGNSTVAAIGIASALAIYYFAYKKPRKVPQVGSIVNGKHIYVRKQEKDEILLVFCHGFGGQIPQFEYQLKQFEKDYSVLAIDYTGHGKSAGSNYPKDYTVSAFAAQVKDAIKSNMGKCQKVVLVGHSFGCMVSITLANECRDFDIAGLVLMAPFGFIDEHELVKFHRISRYPAFLLDFYRTFVDRFGGLNSLSVRRAFGKNVPEHIKEKQFSYNCSTSTDTVKKTLAGFRAFSEDEYRNLKMPIMIISGELDTVCPLKRHGEKIKAILSPEILQETHYSVLPLVGHLVPMEAPLEVNNLIKQFLDTISG